MLLATAYFPPVEYFALLAGCPAAVLDDVSHYEKQSWRNRCRIITADGPAYLNVPVVHGEDLFHTPVGEVLVDYSTPWIRKTEKTIATAYDSSPFLLFYRDELFGILESRPPLLWELNLQIISFFCRKIGIAPALSPAGTFMPPGSVREDYREVLHPKRENSVMRDLGLEQTWRPGISIMDLLFNEGPESICFLK